MRRLHKDLIFFVALTLVAIIIQTSAQAEEEHAALAIKPPLVLVMLGDSLTAGFGLAPEEALPVRLEQALQAQGYDIEIRNAGLSGDTTAGGAERIDWSVGPDVDAVLVGLGANDLLRAIAPEETEQNLESIIRQLQAHGVTILMAGMVALPNYGADYVEDFNAIYPRLSARYDIPLFPFLLDGVATQPDLLQEDGLHPNEAGVSVIVRALSPFISHALFQQKTPAPPAPQ